MLGDPLTSLGMSGEFKSFFCTHENGRNYFGMLGDPLTFLGMLGELKKISPNIPEKIGMLGDPLTFLETT